MGDLLKMACREVRSTTPALSDDEVKSYLGQVKDWKVERDGDHRQLRRVFAVKDFDEALQLAHAIVEIANEQDHHPKLILEPRKVTVIWWTHVIHDLHANDFVMAARVDDLYARWDLISGQKTAVDQASVESFPASDPPAW